MKKEYIDKIYAAWVAKNVGIRFGAPIEGWSYERIANLYDDLTDYPAKYKEFAADDDANGPLFFIRALEDKPKDEALCAQHVAEALLNYAPFEHGFFWWGGYGVSTEHTAYLNLKNGIPAPRSGSIEQNGEIIAEQIGGQIFIDTWGLVNPGNPARAAEMAKEAASVTHGGNGVYGGIFVAACIAHAFEESNMEAIIEKGLSFIPSDCTYAKVVRAVVAYYKENPSNWRECYKYIYDNFGYDKFGGNCHIIPNIAVMILGMLYGEGDFDRTLSITNLCGWDTDCNVGNVATIMGVLVGMEGIDKRWLEPINDLLISSSVIGSLNITDLPYGASYFAKLAYELDGEELPEEFKEIYENRIDSCHFEYPKSTHNFRVRNTLVQAKGNQEINCDIQNTDEAAYSGKRSLKFSAYPLNPAEKLLVYKKTHYCPEDFSDSRYDPCFSPTVYPGMTLHASVMIPEYGFNDGFYAEIRARLYVHDAHSDRLIESDPITLTKDVWQPLEWKIPAMDGVLIDEMGVSFDLVEEHKILRLHLIGFVDDFYADGTPDYKINFADEKEEVWNRAHIEISQMTKFKGLIYMQDSKMQLSCSDFAEAYTGLYNWTDYNATFTLTPITGENHYVNARVQGASRSYAAALMPNSKFAILKKDSDYKVLVETDFDWKQGSSYDINISCCGNKITAGVNGNTLLTTEDDSYCYGSVGVAMEHGSHTAYESIAVRPV